MLPKMPLHMTFTGGIHLMRRRCCRHIGSSTVHRGTAFEERSLKLLQENLSMTLQRVGGREDGGIDLQGWWWLPSRPGGVTIPDVVECKNQEMTRRRLRVIAQCKAEKKKASPKYVRELEGVMLRFLSLSTRLRNAPVHHEPIAQESLVSTAETDCPLVALLVSESPFTKSTLLRAHSSPLPLFLIHIPPLPGTQPQSSQIVRNIGSNHDLNSAITDVNGMASMGSAFWNPALGGSYGVLGGEMEIRWERCTAADPGRPGIWWRNRRLENWVPGNEIDHMGRSVPRTKERGSLQSEL